MKIGKDSTIYMVLTQEEARTIQDALEVTRDRAQYSIHVICEETTDLTAAKRAEYMNKLTDKIDRLTAIHDEIEPYIEYENT